MMKYRPDIDGLRAVAVLSVIVYHVWPSAVPGGFVGVDIFFVISGYLITLQILASLKTNTFSIIEFYRRRIKRIAPAMLVVLLATLVMSEAFFRPIDAEATARSALWSLASMSNVYFWLFEDTSYFAAATDELPLLHFWSLSVEEQFYIFWPPILMVVAQFVYRKSFIPILIGVITASFLFGQLYHRVDASFVYYMLPARAGELMIGALIARMVSSERPIRLTPSSAGFLATLGLILVGASIVFVSGERVFPGFQAIPPTVGTAALIFAGHHNTTLASRCLQWRPFSLIGLISYSAYLWHWPLLAFLHYSRVDLTFAVGSMVIAATMLLAYVTYRYVEIPFRRSRRSFQGVLLRQYVAPAFVIGIVIVASLKTDGHAMRWLTPEYRTNLESVQQSTKPAYLYDYVCQRQRLQEADLLDSNCWIGEEQADASRVILFGDSIAAQYVGLLAVFGRESGFPFFNTAIGACPPIKTGIRKNVSVRRLHDCEASLALAWTAVEAYDVVILGGNWVYYDDQHESFFEHFFSTVDDLSSRQKQVIILGNSPLIVGYDRLCQEKAVGIPFMDCSMESMPLDVSVQRANDRLSNYAQSIDGVHYFDANTYLCPDDLCAVFKADGAPKYYDANHIMLGTSWELGDEIASLEEIPEFFLDLANLPEVLR